MFQLFQSKKNHFVGIDFGTSAVKVVELSFHDQKIHLENYGWADLSALFAVEDSREVKMQSFEEKMRKTIHDLVNKMDISGRTVFISLPGFSGLITLIEFPEMSDEDLEKAIQFESHKYIPSSIEEIAMSWEIVERKDPASGVANFAAPFQTNQPPVSPVMQQKKVQVLLVAAPKKEVVKYEQFLTGIPVKVGAIELETFSIVRSVMGDDLGTALIIDIGARATNIILVEKGIVKVNRNIDAGGNEITETIAESMNISKQRAETFKKGEKDLISGKESPISIPVLEMIVGESMRIISAYKEKKRDTIIDSVIISGGCAKMKGVAQYFNNTLGIKVTIANPWRRITFDEKLKPFIEKMDSSFTVAIGLAMRGIDEYKRK